MKLQYDIRVVGMPAIDRAFSTIERRAARLNSRAARGGGGGRSAGGGRMAMSRQQRLGMQVERQQI